MSSSPLRFLRRSGVTLLLFFGLVQAWPAGQDARGGIPAGAADAVRSLSAPDSSEAGTVTAVEGARRTAAPARPPSVTPDHPALLILPVDPDRSGSYRDPDVALALSAANFIVPVGTAVYMVRNDTGDQDLDIAALAAYGFLFGPATGHIYARNPKWYRGVLIRTGLAAASAVGATLALATFLSAESNGSEGAGALVFLAAGAGLAYVALRDVADAPRAARRANEKAGITTTAQVIPLIYPAHRAGGLALHLRF